MGCSIFPSLHLHLKKVDPQQRLLHVRIKKLLLKFKINLKRQREVYSNTKTKKTYVPLMKAHKGERLSS